MFMCRMPRNMKQWSWQCNECDCKKVCSFDIPAQVKLKFSRHGMAELDSTLLCPRLTQRHLTPQDSESQQEHQAAQVLRAVPQPRRRSWTQTAKLWWKLRSRQICKQPRN